MGNSNRSLIKRLIPNDLKQEGKYFLMKLLKMPYSRFGVSLDILKWLPKGKPITFFDVGANVGQFSNALRGEYEIETGILIEPVIKLVQLLENEFPITKGYKIINAAVSDSIAETDFYVNEDADFVSSLLRIDNKGEAFASLNFDDPVLIKIKTLTLNHIANELQLTNIDLIKIDVQGAEHLVLLGAIEALKKTRLVYTEFSFRPVYENSSTFSDLYKILYDNNFALVSITPGYASYSGELVQGDALFVNKRLLD